MPEVTQHLIAFLCSSLCPVWHAVVSAASLNNGNAILHLSIFAKFTLPLPIWSSTVGLRTEFLCMKVQCSWNGVLQFHSVCSRPFSLCKLWAVNYLQQKSCFLLALKVAVLWRSAVLWLMKKRHHVEIGVAIRVTHLYSQPSNVSATARKRLRIDGLVMLPWFSYPLASTGSTLRWIPVKTSTLIIWSEL